MASELWLPANPADGLGADWRDDAACRGCDPELFFPDTGATAAARAQISTAKRVCRRCPVTLTCLTWALAGGQAGIWGGTTEHERHRLGYRLRASGARGKRNGRVPAGRGGLSVRPADPAAHSHR